MCSSGGEEYDTVAPASLNGTNAQFGYFFSLISQSHQQNPNFFDPSPNYLHHALSQSQLPSASIPNSEPSCTHLSHPPFSSSFFSGNQSIGGYRREAARHQEHDHAVRNSKKRSRASRRAPTTVITTDPSNFRSMVQEFTGIPAPPSSGAAFHSHRFRPFRSSPLNLRPPNPSLPSSSSFHIITTTNAPSENVVDPKVIAPNAPASHQFLPDLGYAFRTPLHLPLPTTFSSTSQPSGLSGLSMPLTRGLHAPNNGGETR